MTYGRRLPPTSPLVYPLFLILFCELNDLFQTFAHAASMRRHRMTSHPETIAKVLPCSACDKEFLSMDGLKRHYNLMHDYRAEPKVLPIIQYMHTRISSLHFQTKTQYQCDSCGKIVESIECLKTHFKLVHNRINWSFKDHSARRVYRSCGVCCKQFKLVIWQYYHEYNVIRNKRDSEGMMVLGQSENECLGWF